MRVATGSSRLSRGGARARRPAIRSRRSSRRRVSSSESRYLRSNRIVITGHSPKKRRSRRVISRAASGGPASRPRRCRRPSPSRPAGRSTKRPRGSVGRQALRPRGRRGVASPQPRRGGRGETTSCSPHPTGARARPPTPSLDASTGSRTGPSSAEQRLAVLGGSKAIDRVRAPQPVEVCKPLLAQAIVVLQHSRHVREVVGAHVEVAGTQTNVRENPCSTWRSSRCSARCCRSGFVEPPETNSPHAFPPDANDGTTPPMMNTQPRLSITTFVAPPAQEGGELGDRAIDAEQLAQGRAGVQQAVR